MSVVHYLMDELEEFPNQGSFVWGVCLVVFNQGVKDHGFF